MKRDFESLNNACGNAPTVCVSFLAPRTENMGKRESEMPMSSVLNC